MELFWALHTERLYAGGPIPRSAFDWRCFRDGVESFMIDSLWRVMTRMDIVYGEWCREEGERLRRHQKRDGKLENKLLGRFRRKS